MPSFQECSAARQEKEASRNPDLLGVEACEPLPFDIAQGRAERCRAAPSHQKADHDGAAGEDQEGPEPERRFLFPKPGFKSTN